MTKGDVGGAQTHVVALAAGQRRAGHDVIVAAGTDGPALAAARASEVTVELVESLAWSPSARSDVAAVGELRRLLRSTRPDLVHTHSSKAGLLTRIAARRERVPSVYTAHGWPFQRGAAVLQRAMSISGEVVGGRLGDAVICLTEHEAALARRARIAPPGRIWVVPNGVPDISRSLRWNERLGDPPHLVMVARFAPPKLQSSVVRTLTMLLDRPWTMTFVGDGPQLNSCRTESDALVGDRVRFLGHRDDVASLLGASDIALLWSRYEGMPIALMEAMRAGLCCIASDLPGVRELFGSPPAGITATTEAELAAALGSVLGDPTLRESLGAQARLRYESAFTLDRMLHATEQVYAAVLARRRG